MAARISIGGTFEHSDFDLCLRQPTLVFCNIEADEKALLDPLKARGLKAVDILVEVHDCFNDGLSEEIAARFKTYHSVAKINRDVDMSDLPDCMETLSDMDRLMALWEWRIGPTTWLWMQARDRIL
ncbi:MAG: hypothetical protein VW728_01060 [Paracoccaceae bacterium]